MSVDYAAYSGKSNTGFHMKVNEDYILFNDEDFDGSLFACIADGSGSKDTLFRPAAIVSHQLQKSLIRLYRERKDLVESNLRFFMEEAFQTANDVLIGFKLGDEAERLNFASTLSCIILNPDGKLTFAHVGNTRIYIVRDAKVLQITKDHTEGQKLVDSGQITEEDYYTAIERLRLYNGIGVTPTPFVQTGQLQLKKNDVIIMTSDGIHYSYSSDAFFDILVQTDTIEDAAEQMIQSALELKVFPDNISVNVIWYLGKE